MIHMSVTVLWLLAISKLVYGCQFYPAGEYLRFVRIPESMPVGHEVLQIEVHPRRNLSLQPVDKAEDVEYFKFRAVNRSVVSVRLSKPLDTLVDGPNPQSVLKFRMVCDYDDGDDTISSYLSVSVYVEDINDNEPVFVDAPYTVTVDEITATGSTIFNDILARDNDKPNTPNSDVHYSIIGGNERGKFSIEDTNPASLLLRNPLDYDAGDTHFVLTILASDRGTPQKNKTTTIAVTVLDNDDLIPKFTQEMYRTQVLEFYPATNRRIHQELKFNPPIQALDQDISINSSVRYDISAGNDKNLFAIDPDNGTIFLERELDLEAQPSSIFTLQIQATQTDNPLKYDTAKVEIELLDINDNLPQFEVDIYNISIVENLPNGFSVLQVVATDQDQGDNSDFVYHLVDPSQAFNIDAKSGWLSVRNQAKLDREQRSSLSMRVYAKEKVRSVLDTVSEISDPYTTVEVTLLDANDNNPMFLPSNIYDFSVSQDASIGQIIGKVEAKDPDLGRNGQVMYTIQKGVNATLVNDNFFAVDPLQGTIKIANNPLLKGKHTLFIEAADQPINPTERRFSLAVVTIHVISSDENHHPEFIGAPYEFWVGNDAPVGTSIGQIRVEGNIEKEKVLYDLLHGYHEGVPFAVEERSGTISVVDEMNKFDRTVYNFEAVATNDKSLSLSANVTVHVVESDASAVNRNNEPVMFVFRVRENQAGAMVGQLIKKNNGRRIQNHFDSVMGQRNQKFVIVNQLEVQNKFAISQDGTIYTQQPLDREERSNYQLTIIAESGKRVIRSLFHVNITVEDENDNPPVFERQWYEGRVEENASPGTEVQLEVPLKITDADAGPNAIFIVAVKGNGSEAFMIDQKTHKITVRDGTMLDRETKDTYNLRLIAKDRGNLSSEAKLTIRIDDINDHTPRFVQMVIHHREGIDISPSSRNKHRGSSKNHTDSHSPKDLPIVIVPETTAIGISIIRLRAADEDIDNNAAVSYRILSETYIPESGTVSKAYTTPHFTIHPISGEVSVASVLPPETDFILNISATDKGGLEGRTSIKIHIKDVNNHAPHFEKAWYDFSIPEGVYHEHTLGQIQATDDDFGINGNISYSIVQKRDTSSDFPFKMLSDGSLMVDGELDREFQEFYTFRIVAEDRGEKPHRTTVDVDVRISDLNDNYPVFYNYDKIIQVQSGDFDDKMFVKKVLARKDFLIPVYYASVLENNGSGVPIARVYANDSDLQANGNGLVLFHIPRKRNQRELFTIDSKEGVITTLNSLDYEEEPVHNITVLASDLGKPSLTSTALVIVDVVDVQEPVEELSSPIFAHRYYEMEVEENCAIPINLLALNVSAEYSNKRFGSLRFGLIPDEHSSYFSVNTVNGSVHLIKSPDRELTPTLKAKIRVDRLSKKGKSVQMIYPMQSDAFVDLAPNEVKLIVHVLDENDNSPKFKTNGRPIVAAIPNGVPYGHPVTKIQATDDDIGLNADIRYQILSRSDDDTHKFIIDPISGQIKTATSFLYNLGHVFGFDVKATDRAGGEDGKSAISNVFVFIISDLDKIIMTVDKKPEEVENKIQNVTHILSGISGLDIKVRKIEPHYDKESQNVIATDLYLYAVDTLMNSIIDNEIVSQSLKDKELEVKSALEPIKVLSLTSTTENEIRSQRSEKTILSGIEAMTIILGCVIFLGAFTAAICVACFNRKKSKYKKTTNLFSNLDPADLPFSLYTGTKSMTQLSACRPRSLFNPLSFIEDSTDSYTDTECHRRRMSYRHNPSCTRNHDSKCPQQSLMRSHSLGMLGASMVSLHSSGRDSGIEAHNRRVSARCQCRHGAVFSSGNSSK
ncbi:cadherin-89D isoform X2 [Planococcus citri]|uniref:cadherin-89D isoform X2 n=1 Tax=Planococcus citri TaxID=170843 RepID=UPI0031F9E539